MFITLINDCRDGNTMGRQIIRLATLFPNAVVAQVGINNYKEIEAAGNLIDMLDASNGKEGIILVNAAPRHKKKWPNGTPFAYFWYKKTLVVTTIDGYCLSLVKKLGIVTEVMLTDVTTVTHAVAEKQYITKELAEHIAQTQFRSYDYMPRLAYWIKQEYKIPYKKYNLQHVDDIPKTVWLIDNFGNAKTTILPEEIGFKAGKYIQTAYGTLPCHTRMKDVAINDAALIIGSSGFGEKRFVEIIVLGGSASNTFGLESGSKILL